MTKQNNQTVLDEHNYEFLANCSDIEFNNYCVRWLTSRRERLG